ncbi:carboxylesterase/lipase family protein [Novosphingobium nitrogenifigens]|nr:carboxylesterase family protein [Novosphingobium nitrogenifigens]
MDRVSRRTALGLLAAGFSIPGWAASEAGREAVVETPFGRLAGQDRGGVRAFLGIPYAPPPVGGGRFASPGKPPRWTGTRRAQVCGAPCLQVNTDFPAWVDPLAGSEDCLYLNVWTPAEPGERPLPVMVWVHGGWFLSGSGGLPLYDGARLAATERVVVVTVNHRLGPLGYLWLGDLDPRFAEAANPGQQDLVAALRWVREGIGAFGGDRANVTVFGESGGGFKTGTLMAMPSARGLFHKAILQSGSLTRVQDRDQASEVARTVMARMGIEANRPERLREVPVSALVAADWPLLAHARGGPFFQPVADGTVVTAFDWSKAPPAGAAGLPMLIGTNRDEAAAFAGMLAPPVDDAGIATMLDDAAPGRGFADPGAGLALVKAVAAARPGLSPQALLFETATLAGFRHSAMVMTQSAARAAPGNVFSYRFDWKTPCFGGAWALHGGEIPFVFGNLAYGAAWDGKDNDALRRAADPVGDADRLARAMMGAWGAFARTGRPDPAWPAYSDESRMVMLFDRTIRASSDPDGDLRRIVADYDIRL